MTEKTGDDLAVPTDKPCESPPVSKIVRYLIDFDVEESVGDYDFRGDSDYHPNEQEQMLMIDYAHGLLSDLIEAIKAMEKE